MITPLITGFVVGCALCIGIIIGYIFGLAIGSNLIVQRHNEQVKKLKADILEKSKTSCAPGTFQAGDVGRA